MADPDDNGDRIRVEAAIPGLQRMAARFRRTTFSKHRHDTYAVGITVSGVQCFSYRGEGRQSVPRQAFVLHPDEAHDGRPGGSEGYGYRIAYIDPRLIGDALGGGRLPFVAPPVTTDPQLRAMIASLLASPADPQDDLAWSGHVQGVADALARLDTRARQPPATPDRAAIAPALALLSDIPDRRIGSPELSEATGLDRWALARGFRAVTGVSPSRYHLCRRVAAAQRLITSGVGLAEVPYATGFADQSHFTRQFRAVVGLSPGAWRALWRADGAGPPARDPHAYR